MKRADPMAREPLADYRRKRDFRNTPEPAGDNRNRPASGEARFVVQKHAARRLHYDLRLESGGVLKSWAVPKGPSLNPADKRLAVETEDHPLDYADFEGVIEEGNYGAGRVIVWDAGTYTNAAEPGADVETGYRAGKIEVNLAGHKLRGGFALVRLRGRGEKNWLLIKRQDADADARVDILAARPESVKSGRLLTGEPGPKKRT